MREPVLRFHLILPIACLLALGSRSAAQHWTQVNVDGFGDPGNQIVYLVPHAGHLYGAAGSLSGADVHRYDGFVWSFETSLGPSNLSVFDPAVFGDQLYLGTYNEATGCEVWRQDATLGTWTRVDPGAPGAGGFGDPQNIEVSGMGSYGGLLYVGTQHVDTSGPRDLCTGAEVWSYDPPAPVPWQQVTTPWSATTCEADGFVEHRGRLFVGVSNDDLGCEVWSFDGASWTLESAGGFGDGSVQSDARGMAVCGDELYVGTENYLTGGEVWRYDGAPWAWTKVADQGFGLGAAAHEEVISLHCFGESLFAGTEGGAAGVLRYDGGTSWTAVDQAGFGDPGNEIVISLTDYGGRLHAATGSGNGTEVWRHEVYPYGCASPAGSLRIVGGTPTQGSTVTLAVDDPSGAAATPSTAFLGVALAPDPSFPCGTPLPGWGELLIGVTSPDPVLVLVAPATWTTPGSPVEVQIPVPADPTLVAVSVYAQAALVGTSVQLTEAFHLILE